jgi:hypothetical protein
MILLDYRVSDSWSKQAQDQGTASVSRFDLNTSFFPGDQIFLIDGNDFSFVGFDLPLLESARVLALAVMELERGATKEDCHPLDVDNHIKFVRRGRTIFVSATMSGDSAQCELTALWDAVRGYAERLLRDVLARFPLLRASKELFEWYPVRSLGLEYLFELPG